MTDRLGPYDLGMVHHADCLEAMRALPDGCCDSIVTDPPYGLSFMGRDWDRGVPGVAFWREALRVSKPGTHLLAFGGTRTYHRLACAIEDAGWEIRDCIAWMYGTGFPKSLDVSKAIDKAAGCIRPRVPGGCGAAGRISTVGLRPGEAISGEAISGEAIRWNGWGTALKPAFEPVVVARKPLDGTVAHNVLTHGTGAMNVDGCRIATSASDATSMQRCNSPGSGRFVQSSGSSYGSPYPSPPLDTTKGRWPANVALDEEAARLLDEQSGELHGAGSEQGPQSKWNPRHADGWGNIGTGPCGARRGDSGGASRFFYTAKASRDERDMGGALRTVRDMGGALRTVRDMGGAQHTAGVTPAANDHPTVKPLSLMRWLVRLVTPPNGIVLDPFSGSGTTGVAAARESMRFLGFDVEPHYVEIANARIAAAREAAGEIPASQAKVGVQAGLFAEVDK